MCVPAKNENRIIEHLITYRALEVIAHRIDETAPGLFDSH